MDKLYWHFVQIDKNGTPHLGYRDNREVKLGETLKVDVEPVLCKAGLHASIKLMDALNYASGGKATLCRVTLGGIIVHDSDKSVGTERTVVSMLDADATEKLLRDFARWCALQVIHLWDAPDVVREYLETGDESLRHAAWAASDASAAGDAARSASAAARAAARSAIAAARAAARSAIAAAWSAGDATSAAARAATSAAIAAAWSAGDAARSAALDAYEEELERRAEELQR